MYVAVFDIVQYDCPVVWLVEHLKDVKIIVTGANVADISRGYEKIYVVLLGDNDTVNKVLDKIGSYRLVRSYEVIQKKKDFTKIRMSITKTKTMEASVFLDATPLAPWIAKDGYERWTLGFHNKKLLNEFVKRVNEFDYIEKSSVEKIPDDLVAEFSMNYISALNLLTTELNKLTNKQLSLLRLALESGYYEWPRKTNIVELSEELGISRAAVTKLLRRAEKRIISSTLKYVNKTTV
ncbi:MAG: helix-turn-helix domain-containing protein [Zestosphaera sp.]